MLLSITSNLLWTQGISIVYVLIALIVVGFFFYKPLLFGGFTLFAFSFYFFRNPERVCTQAINDPSVLICPADGTVVDIQFDKMQGIEGYAQKVSIFLSPFD